jgi:hypothetical protein
MCCKDTASDSSVRRTAGRSGIARREEALTPSALEAAERSLGAHRPEHFQQCKNAGACPVLCTDECVQLGAARADCGHCSLDDRWCVGTLTLRIEA